MCVPPFVWNGCKDLAGAAIDELGDVASGAAEDAASGIATSAWDGIAESFAEACAQMLAAFSQAFVAFPNVDLSGDGITSIFGMSMGIGIVVAVLLLLVQVARTAITHDGKPIAEALVGLGKMIAAFVLTLTIASTALLAADELTVWIVKEKFGSADKLAEKLSTVMSANAVMNSTLLLIMAGVGIMLVMVLWCELLLRNAAIAILIATSPIAAAGMISGGTKTWWSKLVAATIQLIILKPMIALTFALGFSLAGEGDDIGTVLSGMLILVLAVIAWPAIARFYTFASASMSGSTGGGALLGMAATGANKGSIAGINPASFGQSAETRTMQTAAARGSSSGAASTGASKGLAGAGPAGLAIAAALTAAQKGANALPRRMEQMAGHAGLDGANPYTSPAGQPSGSSGMRTSVSAADTSGTPRPSPSAPVVAPPPSSNAASPVQDFKEPGRSQ